jgi:hypothetical protein
MPPIACRLCYELRTQSSGAAQCHIAFIIELESVGPYFPVFRRAGKGQRAAKAKKEKNLLDKNLLSFRAPPTDAPSSDAGGRGGGKRRDGPKGAGRGKGGKGKGKGGSSHESGGSGGATFDLSAFPSLGA